MNQPRPPLNPPPITGTYPRQPQLQSPPPHPHQNIVRQAPRGSYHQQGSNSHHHQKVNSQPQQQFHSQHNNSNVLPPPQSHTMVSNSSHENRQQFDKYAKMSSQQPQPQPNISHPSNNQSQHSSSMSPPQPPPQGLFFPPPTLMSPPQLNHNRHQGVYDSNANDSHENSQPKTSHINTVVQNQQSSNQDMRDIIWGQGANDDEQSPNNPNNYGNGNGNQQQQQYQNHYNNQQYPEQSEQQTQQQHMINNTFWEQKFFMIYEKFQWFGERFEMIKAEYYSLSQLLQTVDSEDDWNNLKQQHQEFAQKLEEMFQELIAVADENQQLMNQKLGEQGESVWQRRYHELLSNFKALQEQNDQMEKDFELFKQQNVNNSGNGVANNSNSSYELQQAQEKYNELMEHCGALQEEYDKVVNEYNRLRQQYENYAQQQQQQNGQNNNGPSYEEYENTRQQYERNIEEIQNAYTQIQNTCEQLFQEKQQLKLELIKSQGNEDNSNLMNVIQDKENTIENLYNELGTLNNQLNAMRDSKERYQNDFKRVQSELQGKINEVDEKDALIDNQSREIQRYKSSSQAFENKARKYEATVVELEQKAKSIEEEYIQKYSSELSRYKNQADRLRRENITLQNDANHMKVELERIHEKHSERETSKYQVQSLEKNLSFLKDQNEQLFKELRDKKTELNSLRGIALQLQKYQTILEQYKSIEREKLMILDQSRKDKSEITSLKRTLSNLELQIETLQSKRRNENSNTRMKQLTQQIEELKSNLAKEQNENNKNRQIAESKQNYINELEQQSLKIQSSKKLQENLFDNERSQYKSKIENLTRKIESLERKNKSLEFEYGQQMKQNYESQISQLRKANETKLHKIKSLQETINESKSKQILLETTSSTHSKDRQTINLKVIGLENSKQDLLTRLDILQKELHNRDEEVRGLKEKELSLKSQLGSVNVQLEEADHLIQNKNKVIEQYQRQIKGFIDKVGFLERFLDEEKTAKEKEVEKHYKEVSKLKETIEQLQDAKYNHHQSNSGSPNRDYSHNHSRSHSQMSHLSQSPTHNHNQAIHQLESNIIDNLNEENSKLKNDLFELTKKLNELQSLSRVNFVQNSPHRSFPSKRINLNAEERNAFDIEERLARFNQRLTNCIEENRIISGMADMTASQRVAIIEKEKRQMEVSYENQIRELKNQIIALEQENKTIAGAIAAGGAVASFPENQNQQPVIDNSKFELFEGQKEKNLTEQNTFLTQKISEQTQINTNLIKLNNELKKQIEQFSQSYKQQPSTTEYYKIQWKNAQNEIETLTKNVRNLKEQNKKLKQQNIEHDTQMAKDYELKLFEAELKKQDLERQISYLGMEKVKAENEKANLVHDVQVYENDLQVLKSSMNNQQRQTEQQMEELRQKCYRYEIEIERNGGKVTSVAEGLGAKLMSSGGSGSPSFGSHSYNVTSTGKMLYV